MSYSALSDSFEYLCYGSTGVINIFTLTVRGSTLDVRNLTSKVDPRNVRVKITKTCVYQNCFKFPDIPLT